MPRKPKIDFDEIIRVFQTYRNDIVTSDNEIAKSSSPIWKHISNQFDGQISTRYAYLIVKNNRHGSWSALNYGNDVKEEENSSDTSFQDNEQDDSDSKQIENIDVIIEDDRDSDYIGERNYKKYDKKKNSNFNNSSKTVKSKLSKRKLSSNDITLSNAVVTLAESLSKSITNYNNTDEQDEWSTLGTLVAKKIRKLKNPLLKLKAENEIQNILWQISVEDAGCSVTYVPNPSNSPNSNNISECH